MKIATIGRGNVGSGLAQRWRNAGHEVTEIGSDGGDVSGVDAVLVAIPSNAIEDAFTGRDEGFESLAHQIKAHVDGPVAKSFNCNFAALYDEIDTQRVEPCNLYAADDGAVETTEQLSRDAGFHPISAGGLSSARMLEEHLALMMAIVEGGIGRFFYRYAQPGEL